MVSTSAVFCSEDPCSISADYLTFLVIALREETTVNRKRGRGWPIIKKQLCSGTMNIDESRIIVFDRELHWIISPTTEQLRFF
jgi:hypothetical protein